MKVDVDTPIICLYISSGVLIYIHLDVDIYSGSM